IVRERKRVVAVQPAMVGVPPLRCLPDRVHDVIMTWGPSKGPQTPPAKGSLGRSPRLARAIDKGTLKGSPNPPAKGSLGRSPRLAHAIDTRRTKRTCGRQADSRRNWGESPDVGGACRPRLRTRATTAPAPSGRRSPPRPRA